MLAPIASFDSDSPISEFQASAAQHRAEFNEKIDKSAELIKVVKEKVRVEVSNQAHVA